MKYLDLNVAADSQSTLQSLLSMSKDLGYSGFAVKGLDIEPLVKSSDFTTFSRFDLQSRRLVPLKKEVAKVRRKHMILALTLGGIDTANWAVEEGMIDLLTLNPSNNDRLRKTTAQLAAKSGTSLEVSINPLLTSKGLHRSRIIKTMSDAIRIATECGMKVILTSGASTPIHLRSPRAMLHIGMVLGLEQRHSTEAIYQNPKELVELNMKRLDDNYILPGLEIVGGDQ